MQIFARDLSGSTLAVELLAGSSCADACEALCEKTGVPSDEVRLVFEGKQLDMERELANYGIEAGAMLAAPLPSHQLQAPRGAPRGL